MDSRDFFFEVGSVEVLNGNFLADAVVSLRGKQTFAEHLDGEGEDSSVQATNLVKFSHFLGAVGHLDLAATHRGYLDFLRVKRVVR